MSPEVNFLHETITWEGTLQNKSPSRQTKAIFSDRAGL